MKIPNPVRAVWRFMRGEDIKDANRRAIAANVARNEVAPVAPATPAAPATPVAPATPAAPATPMAE